MKSKDQTKSIAFMAMYVAMFVVFKFVGNLIPLLKMPNGGSVELEFVVLFVASLHLGYKKGILVALLCLAVEAVLGFPFYIVHWLQFLLDYVLPVVVVGGASILWFQERKYALVTMLSGAMVLKWLCNVLSGVYYWMPSGEAAGSKQAWLFSLGYNTPYNVATLVVVVILVPIIYGRLKAARIVDVK